MPGHCNDQRKGKGGSTSTSMPQPHRRPAERQGTGHDQAQQERSGRDAGHGDHQPRVSHAIAAPDPDHCSRQSCEPDHKRCHASSPVTVPDHPIHGDSTVNVLCMPAVAAHFAPVHFSTNDLPERERLPRWREEFGRSLVQVDIEPVSLDRPFQAEAILQTLPGVRTALVRGSASHFDRTHAIAAAHPDDSFGLVVNLGRRAFASQNGKDVVLGAGDAVPILSEDPAFLIGVHHLGLLFPWEALAPRVENIQNTATVVIPRGVEPLRLLVRYISLLRKDTNLSTPTLRRAVVDHIYDLAALTLGANRDTKEISVSAVAAARLAAVLVDIDERFTHPGLTVASVAQRQGVSPRYLQRLLENAGTSFTIKVNELRLQRAFDLLTKPQPQRRRIVDIAFEAGCSDISHFNRLFRARFGDTPTGVSAQRWGQPRVWSHPPAG
jgi:AraC-like DNA-binding protein